MLYTISSGQLTVKINDLGAEIKNVIYNGEERAWQNDNGSWNKTSPILFPVCGVVSVKTGDKESAMTKHGFARDKVFACTAQKEDEITFCLEYSEETLAIYPFKFKLEVTYKVSGNAITVNNQITNLGDAPMPFALGRHDSFSLKKPVGEYKLCFPLEECFFSQKTDDIGRLKRIYFSFGKGKEFAIPENYLTNGQTVIFGGINSEEVELKTADGKPVAKYLFKGIRNLLIWRPEGAQMVCIEPWSALPDGEDETDVDFMEKKRFTLLSCGEKKEYEFVINYF